MISEPRNPIAAHRGMGVVQIYTLPPESGVLDHYEIQVAQSIDGPYQRFSNFLFRNQDAFINDFIPGTTVYIQIRAVDASDNKSNWVQVSLGILTKPKITMRCRCTPGSKILAGSIFTMPKLNEHIVGFVADEDINF